MSDTYESVTELAKRRGFIWPSGECYGSLAGFIDYGPLGAMMKRRIEGIWRDFYVVREGYYEIECPTIGIESIFVASGHVKGFSDKMCQCLHCGEYLRADHAIAGMEVSQSTNISSDDLQRILSNVSCPACGTKLGHVNVFDFNLMFETNIGPGLQRKGYLRPETAQGMFTDFGRLVRFYRDKLPFGAVQIGKAYRNEISPRQGMIRLREFTLAEAEIFVHPTKKNHPAFFRYATFEVPLLAGDQQREGRSVEPVTMGDAVRTGVVANEYVAYCIALTFELLVKIGVDAKKIRFRQHLSNERAHYASDCWDGEIYSDRFGWVEVVGIADRTDYDLNAHAHYSGTSFTVFIPYDSPKFVHRERIIPNMEILGPRFKGRAKKVADKLIKATPQKDGIDIELNGELVRITPDLYEVREEVVEVRGEEIIPHVIEPSYGIDRMMYAVLEHCYGEDIVDGEMRRVLHLPPWVAPVQVAVFPLMSRDGLDAIARQIAENLVTSGIMAEYDDNGAIGRRYRRQDEIGTPFTITVDYQSLDDHTVTIRERDSMRQVRVPIERLPDIVQSLVNGFVVFNSLSS